MRPLHHAAATALPLCLGALLLSACGDDRPALERVDRGTDHDAAGRSAPTPFTIAANAAFLDQLDFQDESDFDDARRGLLGTLKSPKILDADGKVVWDTSAYAFERGDAPGSVNPSLWRQARLNAIHGLFEVMDGIYQVRGYDLSNMSLIAGETGWIVIDPLTIKEAASASMDLVREHLGDRPVQAVIYTHSHIDHFGGVLGVLSQADLDRGVEIIAPEGFIVEAVSENVLAGPVMGRRASYMMGFELARNERGHVDSGLGKAVAQGSFGLLPPSRIIRETGEELSIDGVKLVFQNTPGAEAPAEMMIYLPEKKALCGAENVSHVLHNVYTLRGAKVRDALRWSGYIQETLDLFPGAEVIFSSHHWPTWGKDAIVDYLKKQRDVYKYIHDQTVRLANRGFTPIEIAEQLDLPESLATEFAVRGYYGTVSHNAKAVYQHYLGWFDGNPANLNPLPPAEAGARYVEAMGGADAVLTTARAAFDSGDYRWVGMLLNHLVFAEPNNLGARALLADAYDQLGYQSESGPWRDFYLVGAKELREGPLGENVVARSPVDMVAAIPTSLFFDALAVRVNGAKAEGKDTLLNFVFADVGETHVLELENAVLHHRQGGPHPDADATVKMDRSTWNELLTGQATLQSKILGGEIDVDGNPLALAGFFAILDNFSEQFSVVTP